MQPLCTRRQHLRQTNCIKYSAEQSKIRIVRFGTGGRLEESEFF